MKRTIVTLCALLFALHGAAAQPNLYFKRITVGWPTVQLNPDPNDGMVSVSLRSVGPIAWHIDVTNVLGQVLYSYEESQPATRIQHMIDIRSAAPGMYLVRVRAGAASWTRHIIRR